MKNESRTRLSEVHGAEARQALTEVVLALFDRWRLGKNDQAALLGLPGPAALAPYRQGTPLADEPDLLERVGHLLAIDRALRKKYSDSPEVRDQWIRTREEGLNHQSPLNVIRRQGIKGLKQLRSRLEMDL